MKSVWGSLVVAIGLFSQPNAGFAVRLPGGPIDSTGDARAAAFAELERIRDAGFYGFEDASVTKRAWLGQPFLSYWTDRSFTAFEASQSDNILEYVSRYVVTFPVHVDDRVLGSINVRLENGRYVFSNAGIGDSQCVRVAQTRSGLNLQPDERLSVLLVAMTGTFLIVENGTQIIRMAPIAKGESTPRAYPSSAFLPAENFIATIRSDIRQFRLHTTEPPARTIQPLDTLR